MLTAVKNQIKVTLLTTKYAIMREMLNKFTFISNVIFMMLNNASMIIQWIIIYGIKGEIGDYGLKQIFLLWALASGTYGIAHFFFKRAFKLSETINTGRLDDVLTYPKNVLLSIITTDVEPSALGDILYGYVMLAFYGITPMSLLLFTLFIIQGGLIIVAFVVMFSSLSFWFGKSEALTDSFNSMITTIATYPDAIFSGGVKIILYTILPIGILAYIPVNVIECFNPILLLCTVGFAIISIILAFIVFYAGLKKYSSSNLMNSKI